MVLLTNDLQDSLLYLDREFVAGRYEILSGVSPQSQVTKTHGKKAGAAIPIFSAEVSAVETRSFPISSLEMLATVMPSITGEDELTPATFDRGMTSRLGWVDAELATLAVSSSRMSADSGKYEEVEKQAYFTLERGREVRLALITSADYFVSGLDALLKMHQVATKDVAIPVRALVRVLAAQTYVDSWIAVPYVMFERNLPIKGAGSNA